VTETSSAIAPFRIDIAQADLGSGGELAALSEADRAKAIANQRW
jgi:hypothetical protein